MITEDLTLFEALSGASVSCMGKTITIECDEHDTKDYLMDVLTGEPRHLDRATLERCYEEISSGLDVHRWLEVWRNGNRKVDETVAIAFYHQALQDARAALRALNNPALTTGKCE